MSSEVIMLRQLQSGSSRLCRRDMEWYYDGKTTRTDDEVVDDDDDDNNNIKLWQTSRVRAESLSTAFVNAFHNPTAVSCKRGWQEQATLQGHYQSSACYNGRGSGHRSHGRRKPARMSDSSTLCTPSVHPQWQQQFPLKCDVKDWWWALGTPSAGHFTWLQANRKLTNLKQKLPKLILNFI